MFPFLRHRQRLQLRLHGHYHHGGGRGPKMFDAGAMPYLVPHLLAEKPRHGYELIKEVALLADGNYSLNPGAIYPLLAMLLDLGQARCNLCGAIEALKVAVLEQARSGPRDEARLARINAIFQRAMHDIVRVGEAENQ